MADIWEEIESLIPDDFGEDEGDGEEDAIGSNEDRLKGLLSGLGMDMQAVQDAAKVGVDVGRIIINAPAYALISLFLADAVQQDPNNNAPRVLALMLAQAFEQQGVSVHVVEEIPDDLGEDTTSAE